MKISKIPGFGNYGQIVDGADFDHITDEEWIDIGKKHLKNFVTVFRNPKITLDQWHSRFPKFGPLKANMRAYFMKKYGRNPDALKPETWQDLDLEDQLYFKSKQHMLEKTEGGNFLFRIYGAKDSEGNLLGAFSTGDVGWHSNESGTLTFAPEVTLIGGEHMIGSATGFVQTADYYESLSESFRSELDEMVIIHKYLEGKINDAEMDDMAFRTHVKLGFCPVEGNEVPLVITSPGGIKGLHYTVNSADSIKGMSKQESERVFAEIDKGLFTDHYIWDHHYQHNNDFLMFDNSITLHRRLKGDHTRKAYHMQYDPSNLLDAPWMPYHQKQYSDQYSREIHELIEILGITNFKLPPLAT